MKLWRPIFPANVPKQVRNNHFSWCLMKIYFIPMENPWAALWNHIQRSLHGRWTYLFVSMVYVSPFHASFKVCPCIVNGDTSGYFITGISLLQALPGEVSQCSACKPHLFSVLSAMSRAGLTTLLNDCYCTLMSWHDQGLSWRSWCWVWNMSFPLSWATSSRPRGWVLGCVSAAELWRQRKGLGCLWAISP